MRAERCRSAAGRARQDNRDWVVKRRERTRQLIELGGLVAKAQLIDLADDDRAVIFGALLDLRTKLIGDKRELWIRLWRRRGRRAFAHVADRAPIKLPEALGQEGDDEP